MNNNRQNPIVKLFPDIMPFRKLASRIKIKQTLKYALSDDAVKKGENGYLNAVLDSCENRWPSEYKKINQQISETFHNIPVYQDYSIDRLNHIRSDMLFCNFGYGFTPNEYFVYRLENKSPELRKEFISSRLRMTYRCKMNNLLHAGLFGDKSKTYNYFKPYFHRDAIAIERKNDFSVFSAFIKKHPVFVKKEVFEAQGRSVELIDINNCGMTERELFEKLIRIGKHICEEKLVQTPELSAFNESSVNTVRAITFNTKHGVQVPYCTIRTGRPGSFVDNGGAGGIQAAVDFETGKIYTDAFDELGGVYQTHPASGMIFKGYQFTEWGQFKKIITELANIVPDIRFIGWDMAHTKDGWTVVEGNENCYVIAKQMIIDKGMRNIFEELMADMDLYI